MNIELTKSLLPIGACFLMLLVIAIIMVHTIKDLCTPTSKPPNEHIAPTSRIITPQNSAQNVLTTASSIVKYKYFLRQHIMTAYEEKFFITLCEIFNDKCYVIPQVHLSRLLNHKVKNQNWQGALSHIDRKSVDFVLLRKADLTVLCAIELDDSSHNLSKRRERDREVERLFASVHLPLVRFKNIDTMTKQEIVDKIAHIIKNS